MIEKYLFNSKKEWDNHCKKYCKDNTYTTYHLSDPSHFPCIAIEFWQKEGDLGSIYTIEDFIYLDDFKLIDNV